MAGLALALGPNALEAASIVPVPLSEMVSESSLVVLGQVDSVTLVCGPCPEPNQRELFVANVKVRTTMKGSVDSNVPVYFSERDTLQRGQHAILLLRPWRDGFATVQGYGGRIDISGDVVPRIYAPGEPLNQSVENVIDKIRQAQSSGDNRSKGSRSAP
jgi:hypothetical protein